MKNAGINFDYLYKFGIEALKFWEMMISSGLVLNDSITWITFHGSFDFAYFVRGLINEPLPVNKGQFDQNLKDYFPNIYDLKVIVGEIDELKNGSLQKLAIDLDVSYPC